MTKKTKFFNLEQRSQQQLQYQQVALAAQQQHYPFYNQQTNQQGQNRSQSNRQQLQTSNQPWSPISPAQWQNPNYGKTKKKILFFRFSLIFFLF